MLRNYLKIAGRNLLRNKLFSLINIVGLAVSMSVGLLLIAFVLDLRSYDTFHEHRERIYRITTVLTANRDQSRPRPGQTQPDGKFATASIKAGRLIRQKVTGADVVILRPDFSQDAKVGSTILPIKGFWADPALFRVFTFPMLEGNPETALKDPYSIVLTQTAAKKLFGNQSALGKAIRFDTLAYQVTGVMQDVPFFSHINFEALVSLSTAEQLNRNNPDVDKWTSLSSNYVYLLLPPAAGTASIQAQLDALAREQNRADQNTTIQLELLPLRKIVVGESLRGAEGGRGSAGPHMPPAVLWLLGGLALVVLLSACFNYANLSMARAMRRYKEVGLRKAIGAGKSQVGQQFLAEAILISLAALVLSYVIFLVVRPQLINLAPEMQRTVKLQLTPVMVIAFIGFSVAVGMIAGFLPALFFSKISAIDAFRNVSAPNRTGGGAGTPVRYGAVGGYKRVTLGRALVVMQYTFTLIFVTATAVGYVQYKNILAFDLGFNTENILNIDMQGNKPGVLLKELGEMPEVAALSRSLIITSVGNAWGGYVKYRDSRDSALVLTNHVDQNYLPLHEHKLVAGGNFRARPTTAEAATEVIVNEQFLKRFNISAGDSQRAIGQEVTFSSFNVRSRRMTIVGVMKDFHYGKVDNLIAPTAFLFWTPQDRAVINAKLQSPDLLATRTKIEAAWKKIDRVHPFKAQFFDEAIEEAYSEYSVMVRIIGFLSLLAISIASLGLFGMVVFTTESRLKEVGIRKVMGASEEGLVFLLSKNFLVLLAIAALVALPTTYFLFEKVILTRFVYHQPIRAVELLAPVMATMVGALLLIGFQTLKAARTNPVNSLRSE